MNHTLESLLALAATDEGKQQIRVMVAEIQGWQMIKGERPSCAGYLIATLNGKTGFVPPFTTSIDAMAEAEKTLNESHRAKMVAHLHYLSLDRPMFSVYFVDALDRAISFILTKQEERA